MLFPLSILQQFMREKAVSAKTTAIVLRSQSFKRHSGAIHGGQETTGIKKT